MTILYKPVKIDSAEQAEALAEETIAYLLHDDGFTDGLAMRLTQTADDPTPWQVMGRFALAAHRQMVGWTALVPVEAEEVRVIASGSLERDMHGATILNNMPDGPRSEYRRTEFHTPWEAA